MNAWLKLKFGAPRHHDRMLALQLGELRPEGIELRFEPAATMSDRSAADGFELAELPLPALLAAPPPETGWVALPVFPARAEGGGGPLPPLSAIGLRLDLYEAERWTAVALLDAFEAAREVAYQRLKLATSPALADPWLIDGIAEDERALGGDAFPVGFDANLEALERVAESLDGAPTELESRFAWEAIEHRPSPRSKEVDRGAREPAGGNAIRCRGLRYVDRTLPLETGLLGPSGGLDYEVMPSLGGALQAVLAGDVGLAEILLGDLLAELAERNDRIVGLPVFPSRRFAQRYLWTAADSELTSLAQLREGRIGFPAGAATAAAWVRALLEQIGVEVTFEAGPVGGRVGRILDRGAEGTALQQRVAAGELDALVTPYAIPGEQGGGDLRLLLPDPAADERAQARAAGTVPISNVLAMNRAAYERDPGAVPGLLEAFAEARSLGRASLLGELPTVGLPSLGERIRRAEELLGGDPYPYGAEANRASLQVFAHNLAAIGAAKREVEVAEMFPPEAR